MTGMRLANTAVALLLMSCPVWASNLVQDYSFEDPLLGGAGAYQYRPTGTAWDFGSGSDGIVSVGPSDVNFFMTSAAVGNQAAFIQKKNSQISQTITGLNTNAYYQVTFFAATRSDTPGSDPFFGGGEDFSIFWNGVLLGTFLPTSTSFSQYQTVFFKPPSESGVLMFKGVDSNGVCNQNADGLCDRTAFIDDVSVITPEPSNTVLLLSGILLIGFGLSRKFVSRRSSAVS
jgi:hypothetical protein